MVEVKKDIDGLGGAQLDPSTQDGIQFLRPIQLPEPQRRSWRSFKTEMYDIPCKGGFRKIVLCLSPMTDIFVFGHVNYLVHADYVPGRDDTERENAEREVWKVFQGHYDPRIEKFIK